MLKPVKGWEYEGNDDRSFAFPGPIERSYWDIVENAINAIFIVGIAALQAYAVAQFFSF